MSHQKRIAIIGTGIAAAAINHRLANRYQLAFYEKARGVGGRMSHRFVNGVGDFDHGAQFFTARDPEFKSVLEPYLKLGLILPWEAKLAYLKESGEIEPARKEARYVASTANSLVKELLQGASIKTRTRITSLRKDGPQWYLVSENDEDLGPFDYVITTAPSVQSQAILGDHWQLSILPPMKPCFCVMLGLSPETNLAWQGAFVKDPILSWFASNNSKGRKADELCLTLHGAEEWSSHYEPKQAHDMEEILVKRFLKLFQLDNATITHRSSHYWRYARPAAAYEQAYLWNPDLNLAMAGDIFNGGRVEGAFLSGLQLAHGILESK
ncbi:NAD(P)/FAD-dependent oxidoreductase [Pseudobacteriovorax antillogorgiicola]|uniref:Amine oxidase domain-containing protein n=1 Tax=Pseudobacteriovorax antillogorgiicola TaxID=1513793 RepID=A0A1Y6CNF0_9BACT|nr:NAD(P)-binding protein [Pseudobacteriovorax antillogorgiicola]TCS44813.1 hypothetical protein EDD56_13142 [Pseudobacteriovorax antillogorgiicola]SMF77287.1 hypothetical protein SAMN06296036_13122 [Pseudobacteriovorax antillogorgiicola]